MTEIAQKEIIQSLPASPPAHVHIEPTQGWISLGLRDLWHYRELLYFLTWRDIKVRYKQTVLGAAWAIIQPFMTMVVFSLFFGRLGKIPSEGIPYPIFSYVALLPWNYFSRSITQSTLSLVGDSNLVKKVFFPRLVIPLSSVLAPLLDFAIAFVVLLGMMIFYQVRPNLGVLLLPAFMILALVTALGVGLWLSALNVKYRDIRYILPFLTQLWMFASPVVYPSTLLEEPWRTIYGLNPMVGVIEGFRWALVGTDPPRAMIYLSTVVSVGILISGALYFRRTEKEFADLV